MAEVGGKWEGIDEAKKLILVLGVLQLKKYLLALIIRNEYQDPLQIQLRWQIQAVDYLMGDASGLGFGSVLWGQVKMVSESLEFTSLYQGSSSNFLEGDTLTTWIEYRVGGGELKDVEFFCSQITWFLIAFSTRRHQKFLWCLRSFSGFTRYR